MGLTTSNIYHSFLCELHAVGYEPQSSGTTSPPQRWRFHFDIIYLYAPRFKSVHWKEMWKLCNCREELYENSANGLLCPTLNMVVHAIYGYQYCGAFPFQCFQWRRFIRYILISSVKPPSHTPNISLAFLSALAPFGCWIFMPHFLSPRTFFEEDNATILRCESGISDLHSRELEPGIYHRQGRQADVQASRIIYVDRLWALDAFFQRATTYHWTL